MRNRTGGERRAQRANALSVCDWEYSVGRSTHPTLAIFWRRLMRSSA